MALIAISYSVGDLGESRSSTNHPFGVCHTNIVEVSVRGQAELRSEHPRQMKRTNCRKPRPVRTGTHRAHSSRRDIAAPAGLLGVTPGEPPDFGDHGSVCRRTEQRDGVAKIVSCSKAAAGSARLR